jgi:protein SCO1/2
LYVDLGCWKYSSAVAALFITLMVGCDRSASDRPSPGPGAPAALAAAPLTDHQGLARSFADFRGKTVVFSFFFTSCPTVCPRETRALSEVQQRLSPALREHVHFVTLSVDPENDTPEAMRKFALSNGADLSGWSFVRTTAAATRVLGQELAAFEASAQARAEPSGHTTAVYLFDASGRLVQRYGGSPLDVPRLASELERLDGWFRNEKRAGSIEVTTLK